MRFHASTPPISLRAARLQDPRKKTEGKREVFDAEQDSINLLPALYLHLPARTQFHGPFDRAELAAFAAQQSVGKLLTVPLARAFLLLSRAEIPEFQLHAWGLRWPRREGETDNSSMPRAKKVSRGHSKWRVFSTPARSRFSRQFQINTRKILHHFYDMALFQPPSPLPYPEVPPQYN